MASSSLLDSKILDNLQVTRLKGNLPTGLTGDTGPIGPTGPGYIIPSSIKLINLGTNWVALNGNTSRYYTTGTTNTIFSHNTGATQYGSQIIIPNDYYIDVNSTFILKYILSTGVTSISGYLKIFFYKNTTDTVTTLCNSSHTVNNTNTGVTTTKSPTSDGTDYLTIVWYLSSALNDTDIGIKLFSIEASS